MRGTLYTVEPNALKFQQSYGMNCSCRRPRQSWADAVAVPEAMFGRRSHAIVVTAKAPVEMSRPKLGQNAKSAVVNAANPNDGQTPGTADSSDPGLDVNDVDTLLEAAAAAISRETSGIKDEDSNDGSHFGLRDGQIVEQDDTPTGESERCALSRQCSDGWRAASAGSASSDAGSQRASQRTPWLARIGSSALNIACATRSLPRSVKWTMSR